METQLAKIANILAMNINNGMGIGLLKGRLGLAIFFYHYASYSKNTIYEGIADDLLDEILIGVNPRLSLDIFEGMSGIYLGLKHLIKHGYIECDDGDVNLFNIERRLFNLNFKNIDNKNFNLSFSKLYMLSRMATEDNEKYDPFIIDALKNYTFFLSKHRHFRIQLSIINSLIFLVTKIDRRNGYSEEIHEIKSRIFTYLSLRIANIQDNRGDVIVLMQLIQTNGDANNILLNPFITQYNNLNIDTALSFSDFIEDYIWQSLLYDLPLNETLLHNIDFEAGLKQLISNSDIVIPVFQGITGIGLYILKNELSIIKNERQ